MSVYRRAGLLHAGRLPGDWMADPLLNTFIHWPEGELARLIFHELSHQIAYAADDTESQSNPSPLPWSASAARAGYQPRPTAREEYAVSTAAGRISAPSRWLARAAGSPCNIAWARATRPSARGPSWWRRCAASTRRRPRALERLSGYDGWFCARQQCGLEWLRVQRAGRLRSACSSAAAAISNASMPKEAARRPAQDRTPRRPGFHRRMRTCPTSASTAATPLGPKEGARWPGLGRGGGRRSSTRECACPRARPATPCSSRAPA